MGWWTGERVILNIKFGWKENPIKTHHKEIMECSRQREDLNADAAEVACRGGGDNYWVRLALLDVMYTVLCYQWKPCGIGK